MCITYTWVPETCPGIYFGAQVYAVDAATIVIGSGFRVQAHGREMVRVFSVLMGLFFQSEG